MIITHEEIYQLIGKDNPLILEMGAHHGEDSQKFLDAFPNVSLHCFEPDPRCIRRFASNVTDTRCILWPFAISDANGYATFHQSDGSPNPNIRHWDYSGSLCKPTGHLVHHPWCTFRKNITVETITLDYFWSKYLNESFIDFIWADIQGAEHKMIRGGKKALQHTRFLYTEYSDNSMYDGQWPLDGIMRALQTFNINSYYDDNVLLENENFRST